MFLKTPGMWVPGQSAVKSRCRTLLNEPVVFFRQEDGTPVALADVAPPRAALEGKLVATTSSSHGLEYNAAGIVSGCRVSSIPPGCRVQSYPVVERYQWIWMGILWPIPTISRISTGWTTGLARKGRTDAPEGRLQAVGREPAGAVASVVCARHYARYGRNRQ